MKMSRLILTALLMLFLCLSSCTSDNSHRSEVNLSTSNSSSNISSQSATSLEIVPLKARDKEWIKGLIKESNALDYTFASGDKVAYIYAATDWGEKFTATKREIPAGAAQTGLGLLVSAYMDIAMLYQVDYGNEPESTRTEIIKRWQLEEVSKKEMPNRVHLKARTVKLHLADILQNTPTK